MWRVSVLLVVGATVSGVIGLWSWEALFTIKVLWSLLGAALAVLLVDLAVQ